MTPDRVWHIVTHNIMTKSICYICDTNLPFKAYTGTMFLDEQGNKPCLDCLVEENAFEREDEDALETEPQESNQQQLEEGGNNEF